MKKQKIITKAKPAETSDKELENVSGGAEITVNGSIKINNNTFDTSIKLNSFDISIKLNNFDTSIKSNNFYTNIIFNNSDTGIKLNNNSDIKTIKND